MSPLCMKSHVTLRSGSPSLGPDQLFPSLFQFFERCSREMLLAKETASCPFCKRLRTPQVHDCLWMQVRAFKHFDAVCNLESGQPELLIGTPKNGEPLP